MKENIIGEAKSLNSVNIRLTFERWYHNMVEKTLEKIYQSIPLIREFPSRHI